MKFLQTLTTAALLAATGVQACIRVHAVLTNNFLTGDVMSVQVYDNDDFYCRVAQGKRRASGDTHWIMDCPNGNYHIELWNNGKQGHITHKVSGKKAASYFYLN
jgi:hypothetical protein